MNGNQIIHALQSNSMKNRWWFSRLCASDRIEVIKHPSAMVVNVDDSSLPGSHWIGLFVENPDAIEVFDSFGREPSQLGENILKFVSNHKNVFWNPIPFQKCNTTVCGAYCTYYIRMKCQGMSLHEIQSSLEVDNDPDLRMYQLMEKCISDYNAIVDLTCRFQLMKIWISGHKPKDASESSRKIITNVKKKKLIN